MRLQKGKIIIRNIEELEAAIPDKDGIKRVIDLDYMGQFEYEGNTIPILRMLIEYNRDKYGYYPVDVYDKNGLQMIFFGNLHQIIGDNTDVSRTLLKKAHNNINENYSLSDYINHTNEDYVRNFWWNIQSNYMIFFGKEKIPLIEYFIDSCYTRDGGKEEIGKKLIKARVKID